jgi:hypothetical protein
MKKKKAFRVSGWGSFELRSKIILLQNHSAKILCLLISVLCPLTSAHAAQRELSERWKVEAGQKQKQAIKFFQAESVQLTETITQNGTNLDLTATNLVVVWEIQGWSDFTNTYCISTGLVNQTLSNAVTFTLTPSQANLTASNYLGFVRALQSTGTNLSQVAVLAYQTVAVEWSPDSRFYSIVTPLTYPPLYSIADYAALTNSIQAGSNLVITASNALAAATGLVQTNLNTASNALAAATGLVQTNLNTLSNIVVMTQADITTMGGAISKSVVQFDSNYTLPYIGMTNDRPRYKLDDGAVTEAYYTGAFWKIDSEHDGDIWTNGSSSFFPPSGTWDIATSDDPRQVVFFPGFMFVATNAATASKGGFYTVGTNTEINIKR